MTKRIAAVLCAVFLILSVAVISPYAAVTSNTRLDDKADLLTADEEAALAAKLNDMSAQFDCDFVYVTTPDLSTADFSFDGTCIDYADRYYESHNYAADGVLVLITLSNERGKRNITFSTSGKLMKSLSEAEQDDILDEALSFSYSPDYNGYYRFFNFIADGMQKAIPPHLKWYMLPLAIGIGFVIALIIMLSQKAKLKSVSMQRGAANYVRAGSMSVTASRDTYLYSTISRTEKPKNDSGGGSRTSSGGGSHGGVSRDF